MAATDCKGFVATSDECIERAKTGEAGIYSVDGMHDPIP